MEGFARIGIDGWSLLLYAVNFGILFTVLRVLLYKPLLRVLDERRTLVKNNLEEAEQLKMKFEQEVHMREQEAARLMEQVHREAREAKERAEEGVRAMRLAAEERGERLLQEAQAEADRIKTRVIHEAEKEILKNMERVILTVLQEQKDQETIRKNMKQAWSAPTLGS
ncbi:ATP synthase F0 subunit B [Candidatus Uhrbacteria bacterium]|nr:ATP synthase F0 subunit B [Candidatus Uhrbacteria bacterium]